MLVRTSVCLAALALVMPHGRATAQCSVWDTYFNPVGLDGDANSALVFDDGNGPQLYAGGLFLRAGNVNVLRVARWDGSLWHPVGAGFGSRVSALAAFDFGSGPQLVAASGSAVHVFDGASWLQVGGTFSNVVEALCVYDEGSGPRLFAGGQFQSNAGNPMRGLARWNGASWTAVGVGVGTASSQGIVREMCVHDDGSGPSLFVGGGFQGNDDVASHDLLRWDGASWHAVGLGVDPDGFGHVYALEPYDDGSGPVLVIGGTFTVAGGVPANFTASWDGASYSAFGTGLNDKVEDLVVVPGASGDELFAGGAFQDSPAPQFRGTARYENGAWVGLAGPGTTVHTFAVYDNGAGPRLHALGGFDDQHANGIAQWDGSSWSPLPDGLGLDGQAYAMAAFDDGTGPSLFVGGSFSSAGNVVAPNLQRLNGGGWSALGPQPNGSVNALLAWDDGSGPGLYCGGSFTSVGSQPARRVARWDGAGWTALGTGIGPGGAAGGDTVNALAVFDDGSGPQLYAGGFFASADDLPASSLARWDGSAWSGLGLELGANGRVDDLLAFDDGNGPGLFVAGLFTTIGGISANRIAKWDGTHWHALGTGASGRVRTLAVFDDGGGPELYAAGEFVSIGGVNAYVARWTGSTWTAVITTFSNNVRLLHVADLGSGPELLAARVSQLYRRANGVWLQLGTFNNGIQALALWDTEGDGTPDVYVAGGFSVINGGFASNGIASFRSCNVTATTYCAGDGSATACPCGNVGLPSHGCDNSTASGGAQLEVSGVASVSDDSLRLTCDGLPPNTTTLFVQATGEANAGFGALHGDGLLCIAGSVLRLGSPIADGEVASVGFGAQSEAISIKGQIPQAGATRFYQVRYRNVASFCTPAAFNQSNGSRVVWVP